MYYIENKIGLDKMCIRDSLTTEAPVVGTGIETKAAVDSGVCVVAKADGEVLSCLLYTSRCV